MTKTIRIRVTGAKTIDFKKLKPYQGRLKRLTDENKAKLKEEITTRGFIQRHFEEALNKAGFRVKQQIIWNKGMLLGRSDYHWAHEPIFYAIKNGKDCDWYGDRTGKTILAMHQPDLEKMPKEVLVALIKAAMAVTTNWEFRRETVQSYMHPTQKPVSVVGMAIQNSTRRGDLVLDLFGGSGSTLMACEIMHRRCCTMELDEKYCDVIRGRWEEHTGQKAVIEKK